MRTQSGTPTGDAARPRETLDELRRVIVGPEQARIRRLEERAALSPENLADLLPEAVAHSHERGDELSIALEAPMTRAVREVARRETTFFATLLSPAIGHAVRRSVAEAIRAMLQRLNEVLERSLSVRSFRWRIEARRTGRSFAEVALLRSLVYRVEHVYLIHTETGLVLEHVTAPAVAEPDPDQVAAMLSALERFVAEAFEREGEATHLARFEVGELTCWVERGARVTVAAVVRGVAPREYRNVLREARERIELEHRADLRTHRPDVTRFLAARPTLDGCLRAQRTPPRHARAATILVAVALALAVIGLLVLPLGAHARTQRRLAGHVEALRSRPGIVVTSARRSRHGYAFSGLRDPLAEDPRAVLAGRGLRDADLRFEPFYSLDPRLTERRIARTLAAPAGVRVKLDGATLKLAGTAPRSWVERARSSTPSLPGVDAVDTRDLHPAEAVEALRADARALEAIEVPFATGSASLDAQGSARVRRAAAVARRLPALAEEANMRACVDVTGDTDRVGDAAFNQRLSEARAETVAAQLRRLDTTGEGVVVGLGSLPKNGVGRRATFHVSLGPATGAPPCAGRTM